MRMLKKQKGVSLLEAISFLGIAAIVIAGSVSLYRGARGSAEMSSLSQQLSALQSNIKMATAGQSYYGTSVWSNGVATQNLNASMINAEAIPDGLRVSGSNLFNSFGGLVRLDGDATSFWIRYENVPQDVCVKLAPQTGTGWMGLSINGNWSAITTAPIAVSTAVSQCSSATSNYLIWRSQ